MILGLENMGEIQSSFVFCFDFGSHFFQYLAVIQAYAKHLHTLALILIVTGVVSPFSKGRQQCRGVTMFHQGT